MNLLDPYGYALQPDTPAESPAGDGDVIPTPGHAEEVELAKRAPEIEVREPGPAAESSDLDPAMRLQDAVGTWHGDGGEPEGGEAASAEEAGATEPYAPLMESDDEGL